ncbi:hypothetical protein BDK51DRAFT_50328 [Blyttiomyces helicus]|uniref:Uncharacterized protein n=1 Tax=Blyttiomyces helicus TaxID=388810 RepID=A0A4P9WF79_9FUNG|nr:hypothetical protein BDK51DRAFT_50328 [Blyttiomyces helicus]|eukprot:RKO89670.1 hypothetical protein BDK51DRAFT_50328 [Blyttiomyces helicus]
MAFQSLPSFFPFFLIFQPPSIMLLTTRHQPAARPAKRTSPSPTSSLHEIVQYTCVMDHFDEHSKWVCHPIVRVFTKSVSSPLKTATSFPARSAPVATPPLPLTHPRPLVQKIQRVTMNLLAGSRLTQGGRSMSASAVRLSPSKKEAVDQSSHHGAPPLCTEALAGGHGGPVVSLV